MTKIEATDWQTQAQQLRDAKPTHILFLCAANSARSQLAEGLGMRLAGQAIRISSAGLEPTEIRPETVQVLGERHVEAAGQRASSIDELEGQGVDAVITLCAEASYPAWLEQAHHVHWPLPAPALGDIEALRDLADELETRLRVLFDDAV